MTRLRRGELVKARSAEVPLRGFFKLAEKEGYVQR
jgi:hypothetical protein